MKKLNYIGLFTLILLGFWSCNDDDSLKVPDDVRIGNFIWKGLNLYYFWQEDVPDLADNRFANQSALNDYLRVNNNPETLFEDLLVDRSIDRFSVLYSDYRILEGVLSGTTKNNGVDFGLRYKPGSSTEIFGWVRYVLPNSNASETTIQRGDLFYAVNGTPLTVSNYQNLLNQDSYTLNLATYDSGNITPTGESVALTKTVYSENPVYQTNTYDINGRKVGYLVYNGFYPNYNNQLNDAFGNFASQGVNELILDLRYNSGGSVQTSTYLASMITGQFNGQVFSKEKWNEKLMGYYNQNNPSQIENRYTNSMSGTAINSLQLTRIFILTSPSTASASELIINGLKPYINVIQIGEKTTGKNVGSVTLYDSEDYRKEGADPTHFYAMQPIVLQIVNRDNFGDYVSGLEPQIIYRENMANLGQLGSADEPLLQIALQNLSGSGRVSLDQGIQSPYFQDRKSMNILLSQMYSKLPAE